MYEISGVDTGSTTNGSSGSSGSRGSSGSSGSSSDESIAASVPDGTGTGTIRWTDSDGMPQGGWQGGRGWQLNGTSGQWPRWNWQ